MLRHSDIWRALDRLAGEKGLTASGLARRAGLDPTTFNKSKRVTRDGKLRWPSTESLAKVLEATTCSLAQFVSLIDSNASPHRHIPVLGYAQAGEPGMFDERGCPAGDAWDQVAFPAIDDPTAFALEITGESMEPCYRDGDVIIVSPTASARRGDRVVVRLKTGDLLAKVLQRDGSRSVELAPFNTAHPKLNIAIAELAWMARIIWASQ
ncbi:MAG TPA: helix-turn-helix transcriptional regulator [Candidatus Sulfotelmatobacter sp.]|nr:helix-turn-helix transcriptional regulator [Candidatus Sulfotelmatobacter sp.]HUB94949.1 helix-turn-helix transcriptional regulator [Stellaceae bacterium]